MEQRVHAVTIDIPGHGEFKARLGDVKHAHRTYAKRALARQHWLVFEKWELAIVYCGMISPLN